MAEKPLTNFEFFNELADWHEIAEELAAHPEDYKIEEGVDKNGHDYIKFYTKDGKLKAYADLSASSKEVEKIMFQGFLPNEKDTIEQQNSHIKQTYLYCIQQPGYFTIANTKNGDTIFLHEVTPQDLITSLRIYHITPTGPNEILAIRNPSDPLLLSINEMVRAGFDPANPADFSEYETMKSPTPLQDESET